jgi:hypothetical protein
VSLEDARGQLPPGLVLLSENPDEVGELSGLLEAREEVILLELLVVVLQEALDDRGRAMERVGRERLVRPDPPNALVVDQQDPVEDTVLAHEVLARPDSFVSDGLRRDPGLPCGSRQDQPRDTTETDRQHSPAGSAHRDTPLCPAPG